MVPEQFLIHDNELSKWIRIGCIDLIERFNLKLQPGLPDYPYYYFVKKNTNRYFRKHLGFTYCYNVKSPSRFGTITVTDARKLMLFKLKYLL